MTTPLAGRESLGEVSRAKIPYQEHKNNFIQNLVAGVPFLAATPVISKPIGLPDHVDLAITPTVTGTIQVFVSVDGVKFFHDTTLDIAVTAGTDKTVRLNGFPYYKFVASVDQTGAPWLVLLAKYA